MPLSAPRSRPRADALQCHLGRPAGHNNPSLRAPRCSICTSGYNKDTWTRNPYSVLGTYDVRSTRKHVLSRLSQSPSLCRPDCPSTCLPRLIVAPWHGFIPIPFLPALSPPESPRRPKPPFQLAAHCLFSCKHKHTTYALSVAPVHTNLTQTCWGHPLLLDPLPLWSPFFLLILLASCPNPKWAPLRFLGIGTGLAQFWDLGEGAISCFFSAPLPYCVMAHSDSALLCTVPRLIILASSHSANFHCS